jgi:UDP-glucose 4-epimerase
MTTVAITGVNSYFARMVLPRLQNDPDIKKIIGIDIAPFELDDKKVEFFREDVRSDKLPGLLKGVDTVLHLAFIVEEIHDKKKTHEINIDGSKNVFRSCVESGVKKIVYTSSIAAYGAHPDNPIGITEEYPLVENKDSYYSTDKVAVERFLKGFREQHPEIKITILRPPIIIGPNLGNVFREEWERKLALIPKERDNPIQFLHEDDLGEAIYLSVKRDIPGIFNIAADDSSSMQKLYEIAGIKTIKVSTKRLKTLTNVLFALRLYHFSQGWVSLGEFPIIVNNEKFKKKTGWKPRYTTEGAFRDLMSSIG